MYNTVTRLRERKGIKTMTIYSTRYQAKKNAKYGDVVVKVDGGYVVMDARDYRIWKKQK